MEFVALVVVTGVVAKVVDFARFARARDVNAIAVQVLAWAAGVGVVWWAAQTAFADDVMPGLASMNFATQALVGVGLASAAGLVNDARKAVDQSQSAKVPPLVADRPQQS